MQRENIEEAIQSLDELLKVDAEREEEFQRWCLAYPVVFIALGFQRHIPHPRIQSTDGRLYIPDFIAQRPNQSWEIIELKTPSARILKDKDRRETFYSDFESYLSQCHDYSEALDDTFARTQLEQKFSIVLHKRPTTILIAGSGESLDIYRLFRLCNRRNPPIAVYTYDDIRSALLNYRAFNFGPYDKAEGISIHWVISFLKPEGEPTINHILDIGVHQDRDRVAIFVDSLGYLRLRVWDSNGEQHNAKSNKPFDDNDYDVMRWILFEVGLSDGFGFISIQIDGRYYADIRIRDFPFSISHEYVIGSDWAGENPSWFSEIELAVMNRALKFSEKMKLREHVINHAGEFFPPEIMDFNWAAYYTAGIGQINFRGHQFLYTTGHPVAEKQNAKALKESQSLGQS